MSNCKIVKSQGWVRVGLGPIDVLGNREILSEKRDGYDVTIPNAMGSTTRFVEHLSEAFSLIGKYDNEAHAIEIRSKELSKYLSSDEGAWGRQDSFDNNLK